MLEFSMQSRVLRKCGKKSETSERKPIFGNNRRSWKRKTGVWSVDLGFSPHFWIVP